MDKNDIKEKGRYMFIRQRARTIREKPGKHLPRRAQQAKLTRLMREQFIAERKKEKQEAKPEEQVEEFSRDALEYFGGKTHFTVKSISQKAASSETKEHSYAPPHIKEKPNMSADIKDKAATVIQTKGVKAAPKLRTKPESSSPAPADKAQQIALAKKSLAAKTGKKTAAKREAFSHIKRAVLHSSKSIYVNFIMYIGALFAVLVPFILVFGFIGMMFDTDEQRIGAEPLSEEVIELSPYIFAYACEHEVEEYVPLIKALIMQESAGRGTDPMQASECIYNTKYPNSPGGITEPEYSIDVGIQYFKDCLELAEAQGPDDIDGISLALQGYNFGSGYIPWAKRNYGGHSELSALEFSQMMANRNGWTSYGDIHYVNHVLRYYSMSESTQT